MDPTVGAPPSSGTAVAPAAPTAAPAAPTGAAALPAAAPPASAAPPSPPAVAPPADPAAPPAAVEPPKPKPGDVPYETFAEAHRERTVFKRQVAELEPLRGKLTEAEQQIARLQGETASAAAIREEHEELMAAINRDPTLRERVLELIDAPGARRPIRPAAPSGQPPVSPIDAELRAELKEVTSVIRQAKQVEDQAREHQRQSEFDSRLDGTIATFLAERQYDPALQLDPSGLKLGEYVRDLMAADARALRLPDEGIETHVPHLLNRAYARLEAIVQGRSRQYVQDKIGDARNVPPSAPGGAPPVSATPNELPIADPRFKQDVAAYFANRMAGRGLPT